MPFGTNVKTLMLAEAWAWAATRKPKTRRVEVPEVDAPWWWSEYLIEEWKRLNHYKQVPRDARTGLQKSEDEWKRQAHRWSVDDPHFAAVPVHTIWAAGVSRGLRA